MLASTALCAVCWGTELKTRQMTAVIISLESLIKSHKSVWVGIYW